jgi:hypothetical protein
MDDAPDRAGLHELPRLYRRARLEALGKADRVDAAGLLLYLPQLGELRERRHARLVGHHILADTHRPNGERRAVGEDRGGYEQLDGRVFENLGFGPRTSRCRIARGEIVGKRGIRLEERNEFGAGVRQAVHLAADVAVVGTDNAEADGVLACHRWSPVAKR